jgi:hypothetical protein
MPVLPMIQSFVIGNVQFMQCFPTKIVTFS